MINTMRMGQPCYEKSTLLVKYPGHGVNENLLINLEWN